MEYTANLWTLENGKLVKKNMSVDSYFSLSPYIEGDDDGDVIECATLAALYMVWQEEKSGDNVCGERGHWKYHFITIRSPLRKTPLPESRNLSIMKRPAKYIAAVIKSISKNCKTKKPAGE